jgi:hypothetical protein
MSREVGRQWHNAALPFLLVSRSPLHLPPRERNQGPRHVPHSRQFIALGLRPGGMTTDRIAYPRLDPRSGRSALEGVPLVIVGCRVTSFFGCSLRCAARARWAIFPVGPCWKNAMGFNGASKVPLYAYFIDLIELLYLAPGHQDFLVYRRGVTSYKIDGDT